ncbi:MAG: undecaprenyl/decaprenyl-phosphate alpha-N-acetylglucosaminyl 1-phosphate transferase [Candidatus Tectomicrobia bacterium]|uniref:Undecaprenyl/decaprenyl-phosphate alpha-N-acetylglucosaminyl 1-phosphate transferase n=1 Tax=Tectimicrobiota bacterium TaxID=2528274 RepID=A0A932FV46_UNCTE|nr:undecaprenyl/decaprenyl-phosphate alpha-N-acetylglucosaminyl 1-phosphate transferase [Candidatus Tectomicrobia bacterium]
MNQTSLPVYLNGLFYLLAFVLALAFSLYGVPMARRAALKLGIVDRPDGRLKRQREPVPYLGGLAIYLSFLAALALTYEFSQEVLGLILGGTLTLLLGLIDDFSVLTPREKIFGQLVAISALVKAGITIQLTFLPGWVALPLTVLWLLAITNAFNLIDVMDGLSAGVAFTACLALFGVALLNGRPMIAILTAALAGSILGFLRYNFEPARIYLGDSGSLFLGLMLGALAMIGSYSQENLLACLAPLVILGVPLFDLLFVMYVRHRRGLPLMQGSPDHFALRLKRWRLSTRQTTLLSYLLSALLGGVGLAIMRASAWGAGLLLATIAASALLAGHLLGRMGETTEKTEAREDRLGEVGLSPSPHGVDLYVRKG